MSLKLVCLAVVALVCINYAYSAPHGKSLAGMSEHEVAEKFAQFLKDDKEMSMALHSLTSGSHHLSRRQAEDVEVEGEQPGFFDRAAKFVMELLQRFLKWINTE